MSIQSVAIEAGVSAATVSRVFNFPAQVKPATREHVMRVANELGYVPNASARALRTQRSKVLGVLLPTLLNPVFAECLQGIAQAAAAAGYAIVPVTSDYRADEEQRAIDLLLAGNVDGMILVVSDPATSKALPRLGDAGMPYVLAYNRHPDHPCVSVDSEAAVARAVAHAVALGHRRIAMVSGRLADSDRAQHRYRGFLQGMAAAGLVPGALIEVPFIETAVILLSGALQARPRPTALICSNDLMAIRCLRAAHLSGLQVPHDLSVIGFDGIAIGEDLTPALCTVAQPNADIGRCSVGLLVQTLRSGHPLRADASVLLPHSFRIGESCAAPSAHPPLPLH